MKEPCFACGGLFDPTSGGVTHAYMASTPGCWEAYGALLAREYADAALFARVHRLTVDAFALQHPGDSAERRARQSFWIHGASLWLVLRMGRPPAQATAALKRLAEGDFPAPPPPGATFVLTHADVLTAPEAEHARQVKAWAEAALAGCAAAHADFAALAQRAG